MIYFIKLVRKVFPHFMMTRRPYWELVPKSIDEVVSETLLGECWRLLNTYYWEDELLPMLEYCKL